MKVVFMGTPSFAIPTLEALINSKHSVEAIVTVPDKLGGRSQTQLLESDIKKYARNTDIPILQPHKLNGSKFLNALRRIKADVFVVVAFRKLPKLVWNLPSKGTINIHGSLLPKYRGAAPINWAIINGDTISGLTTFYINDKIDQGEILLQSSCPIDKEDTAGDLHDKLMELSGPIILETLEGIENGSLKPQKQDESLSSHAPKVFFDQNELDCSKSTQSLNNFIRGMSPYPAAWINYEGKTLKIFKAKPIIEAHSKQIGSIELDYKSIFKLYTADGYLQLEIVQWAGKRKMNIKDFLNGLKKPK
ncbi:methionyl-tRNA formyltransferase [Membranihabitans marinus]|uniref:methionyl-tRNA formyltransferase n=1 Tax=Membranihabitans marinus TaxID=1227546 RepID=UPI001F022FAB|nr:methionyl-tRNA formyltransferase [Membranihabitans marinus]